MRGCGVIGLLVVGGYLVGWVISAALFMRAMADRIDSCGGHYCIHLGPHWRGDGKIGGQEVQCGALAALAWPVLWLLPALAYLIASRRPTPRAMQLRIAELEREVGIR